MEQGTSAGRPTLPPLLLPAHRCQLFKAGCASINSCRWPSLSCSSVFVLIVARRTLFAVCTLRTACLLHGVLTSVRDHSYGFLCKVFLQIRARIVQTFLTLLSKRAHDIMFWLRMIESHFLERFELPLWASEDARGYESTGYIESFPLWHSTYTKIAVS